MYQPLRSPTMANWQMCFHEQFFQVASYWQMRHLSCGPVWFPDSQSPVNWWHIAWTIKRFKSSSGRISHRVAWYNWMLYRLTLCFLVNFPPPGCIKDLWLWVHFQHFHILKFLDYPHISHWLSCFSPYVFLVGALVLDKTAQYVVASVSIFCNEIPRYLQLQSPSCWWSTQVVAGSLFGPLLRV